MSDQRRYFQQPNTNGSSFNTEYLRMHFDPDELASSTPPPAPCHQTVKRRTRLCTWVADRLYQRRDAPSVSTPDVGMTDYMVWISRAYVHGYAPALIPLIQYWKVQQDWMTVMHLSYKGIVGCVGSHVGLTPGVQAVCMAEAMALHIYGHCSLAAWGIIDRDESFDPATVMRRMIELYRRESLGWVRDNILARLAYFFRCGSTLGIFPSTEEKPVIVFKLLQAIQQKDIHTLFDLARFYRDGYGTEPNTTQAFDCLYDILCVLRDTPQCPHETVGHVLLFMSQVCGLNKTAKGYELLDRAAHVYGSPLAKRVWVTASDTPQEFIKRLLEFVRTTPSVALSSSSSSSSLSSCIGSQRPLAQGGLTTWSSVPSGTPVTFYTLCVHVFLGHTRKLALSVDDIVHMYRGLLHQRAWKWIQDLIDGNNVPQRKEFAHVYWQHIGRPELVDCPICMGGYNTSSRIALCSCGHTSHETCMQEHIQYSRQCPVCRVGIHHVFSFTL